MALEQSPGSILAKRLSRRCVLSAQDMRAVMAMTFVMRDMSAGAYLIREGQRPTKCQLIMAGSAVRHKLTDEGGRQIVSVLIASELADAQNLFLPESDHNVQALTRIRIAEFDVEPMRELVLGSAAISRAMWIEALTEASIYREWLVNVGRRDARRRIGHLLCEINARLSFTGIPEDSSFELPMTQEQLGDAVGLTPVHVNRVLKTLSQEGLIHRDRRVVTVPDWPRLREVSDFDRRYLHQDVQVSGPAG